MQNQQPNSKGGQRADGQTRSNVSIIVVFGILKGDHSTLVKSKCRRP